MLIIIKNEKDNVYEIQKIKTIETVKKNKN